jgi:hypothetical protein
VRYISMQISLKRVRLRETFRNSDKLCANEFESMLRPNSGRILESVQTTKSLLKGSSGSAFRCRHSDCLTLTVICFGNECLRIWCGVWCLAKLMVNRFRVLLHQFGKGDGKAARSKSKPSKVKSKVYSFIGADSGQNRKSSVT